MIGPSTARRGSAENPIITTSARLRDLRLLLVPMDERLELLHPKDQEKFIVKCREALEIAFPEFYPGARVIVDDGCFRE